MKRIESKGSLKMYNTLKKTMRPASKTLLAGALLLCFGQSQAEQLKVSAQAFSKLAFFPEHRASAHVEPLENSKVSAEIMARILKIPVHVGDVIEAGSVVAELDCADYQFNLQREKSKQKSLEAQLSLASYQLQRAKKLSKQQAVAEELLRQRETEALVLQSQRDSQAIMIQQANNNVDKCKVRTLYKAIVVEKMGQVGELANPGTVIVRIIDALRFEVSAKVQAHLVTKVAKAKSIMFNSAGKNYPLKLVSITPSIETRERTQEVRLQFSKEKPLPGAAGEIVWFSSTPHIPSDYMVKRKGRLGVFISENNKAKFVNIPSAIAGRSAPVKIDEQQKVVTKGRYQLHDGDDLIIQ